MDNKVTKLRQREYFTYDRKAQSEMSSFARFLVETGFMHEPRGHDPRCFALISANPSSAYQGADRVYNVDTTDAEALRRFISALEEIKHHALCQLAEIDDEV